MTGIEFSVQFRRHHITYFEGNTFINSNIIIERAVILINPTERFHSV